MEGAAVNESAESVVRAFIDALPRWRADELTGYLADGATWTDGHSDPCVGIEAIKACIEAIGRLIPGPRVEVGNLLANDSTVMVERVDLIRLKGESFEVDVIGVFDVDGDGRIARWREYYDSRTLEERIIALLSTP